MEETMARVRLGIPETQVVALVRQLYSYANYDDHLGIGNVRFDKLMPDDVDTLEQAEREGWDDARLARALDVPEDKVEFWRESYRRAKDVVDAPTPAESFRRGVRYSILDTLEEGLADVVSSVCLVGCRRTTAKLVMLCQALRHSSPSKEAFR
jgi:hypothetical protein